MVCAAAFDRARVDQDTEEHIFRIAKQLRDLVGNSEKRK